MESSLNVPANVPKVRPERCDRILRSREGNEEAFAALCSRYEGLLQARSAPGSQGPCAAKSRSLTCSRRPTSPDAKPMGFSPRPVDPGQRLTDWSRKVRIRAIATFLAARGATALNSYVPGSRRASEAAAMSATRVSHGMLRPGVR